MSVFIQIGSKVLQSERPSVRDDWPEILDLNLKTTSALTVTEFIGRSKLDPKLAVACKIRAERDKHEEKNKAMPMEILINQNKEEFGITAGSFVTYLFNTVQSLKPPTSDIVKGLGAFDLETLLIGRISHAMHCFSQLFSSFRLRSYFELEQETVCREEYRSFIDEMRNSYPDLTQPTLLVKDTVKFLGEQSALKSRPLLSKVFRFSCLCLDEPFETLPAIKFGSVNSDDPTSSHIDAVLPVQSYFHNVLFGVEAVTTDQSVSSFLWLEPTFGNSGLSDIYCPWQSVDFFGREEIIEQLDPGKTNRQNREDDVASSVRSSSKRTSPKKTGKITTRPSRLLTNAELSQSAEDLLAASGSKP